jgi:LPXTG-motif cell wall-anchored protein
LIVSAVPDKNYGDNTFALEVSHDGDGALSFTSDKEKVATVDADGNVTIKGAGTAKLTVTLAESANYTAGTADVTIKVAKTPHGMTVDSIKYEKTYGDKPFAVTATADDSETNITYTSSDESVATVDENGVVTIHKAGTAEITVAMAESDNHTAVSTKITVDVKAKPITVKAKDTSKTYGDTEPELSYEVLNDGLVEGDSLADVTVTRENGEDVKDGGYVMTATADKTANPNYDITFETGTFTINPKDILNATVALGTALKYTGKEQTQEIDKIIVGGIEVPADSYEVTGNTATEAGVYTLTITAKDGSNFTGTKTWTYVVAPTKTEQIKENEDGKIELGNGTVTIAVKADDNAPKTTLVTGKAEIIDMLVKSGDITADELSKIANGASVDIVLTVKDASATVSNEAKSAMTDTASKAGYTIGQYIDISLYKYMTVDGVTDDGVQLHSTADKIKIAVQIPDSLINKDSKVNRTYYIVRYHDGKAEIIEGTYDEATHTFTFETDKFSDYAIAYKDVKVADKTTTDNSKKPSATKSVKTGDTSNPMLYGMLLLLSMMGIVLVFIRRRKSER